VGTSGAARVRATGVVLVDELVEPSLELCERAGSRVVVQPPLHRLVDPFDLAARGRVVRSRVLLHDVQALELGLKGVATTSASGQSRREDHAVVCER
jgi:hypothetical protein